MIELQEKQDVLPLCASCAEPLDRIWVRELKTMLGKRYIYFCPHCRKTLGVSHRKGFFMG